MSKERPILFSGQMVRAILDGRKTQTRRIVKPGKDIKINALAGPYTVVGYTGGFAAEMCLHWDTDAFLSLCPYGNPGDRLWVRERHAIWEREAWIEGGVTITPPERGVYYWADQGAMHQVGRWSPSIHMPRWASRITLEVVSVRVERLQDISEEDAMVEGVEFVHGPKDIECGYLSHDGSALLDTAKRAFYYLWESINGPGSWERNDWVWVVEFKRIQP